MSLDSFDDLRVRCRTHAEYPRNLMRKSQFKHVLDAYVERLANEAGSLFIESGHVLYFWEAPGGPVGMVGSRGL